MTVESASDRATMLADFGLLCIFSPGATYPNRNDKSVSIRGIFDNGFYDIIGAETDAASRNPTLTCRTDDVNGAMRNSMIEIGGDVYKVVSPEPDGTGDDTEKGITVLMLEGPA